MTIKQFQNSKDPLFFMVSINPMTGERNFEYCEGSDWDSYYRTIKTDFPERFHFGIYNETAKAERFDRFLIPLTSEDKQGHAK